MRLYRYMILLSVLALTAMPLSAQLLYKISGKGLSHPSYLFGTHHLIPVSSVLDVDNVFRCYNDCEAVVGELVIDEEAMAERISRAAMMDENINKYLTRYDSLLLDSALFEVTNLHLKELAYMRPSMIENIYSLSLYERCIPKDDKFATMDSYFQYLAVDLNKKIYGLETIDKQIEILFHSTSIKNQVKSLLETVRKSDDFCSELERFNALYLSEDLDAIYKKSLEIEGYSKSEKYLLLDARNEDWIDKIVTYIEQCPCFIAVGALHLPGKEGLIEMLKEKGYKVQPVTSKHKEKQ